MRTSPARGLLTLVALAVLALLPLAGCASSPTIRTDHDTTVSFEGWTTWAWTPQRPEAGPGAVSAVPSLHDGRIRRSVESALAGAGYTRVAPDQADFLITYVVRITNESDVVVWEDPARRYHWRNTWRPVNVSVHRYEIGTLILDVVQRSSTKIVWRGWAEAEVDRGISAEKRDQQIDRAVRDILALFPPK